MQHLLNDPTLHNIIIGLVGVLAALLTGNLTFLTIGNVFRNFGKIGDRHRRIKQERTNAEFELIQRQVNSRRDEENRQRKLREEDEKHLRNKREDDERALAYARQQDNERQQRDRAELVEMVSTVVRQIPQPLMASSTPTSKMWVPKVGDVVRFKENTCNSTKNNIPCRPGDVVAIGVLTADQGYFSIVGGNNAKFSDIEPIQVA